MSDPRHHARQILGLMASKWACAILRCLVAESRRPSEMMELIGGVSQKMLLQTLRKMERYGLVARKVYAVVPPRVDYLLTPLGRSLVKPLEVLEKWARAYEAEMNAVEFRRGGGPAVGRGPRAKRKKP